MGLSGMVSCRTTPVSATQKPAKPAPVKLGVSKTPTYSPLEARPGAKKIHFAIMEITVDETRGSFWSAYLAPGVPRVVAFDSLRIAADKKGVDLMTLPDIFEGQQMNYRLLRELPASIEAHAEGTGKRMIVTGETTKHGTIIETDLDLRITELEEITPIERPDGTTLNKDSFKRRNAQYKNLQIPNGGFVILNNPDLIRYDSQLVEESRYFGLIRNRLTQKFKKYIAIAASTEPQTF